MFLVTGSENILGRVGIQITTQIFLFGFTTKSAQSVTCLATDVSLTADPGVASSIPARSHTFLEIDHEIISMVILLPSAESFNNGCCQLVVTSKSTKYLLTACSSFARKKCG